MLLFWFLGICLLVATEATDCPNFWVPFDGSCYRFGHQDLTFVEAEHYCQQHQAHLVHIETQDENNFLKQELTDLKDHSWWIGLSDDDVEGTFVWYGTNTKPEFTEATDCPNIWVPFDGSCYRFGHQDLTYVEAEHYCQQHQAHLVHIETQDENNFLKQELTDRKDHSWWIGLSDDDVEGTFVWYGTNNKLEFTDWSPGEPSDTLNNEDCVEFYKYSNGFRWNDAPCHALIQAICEKESATGAVIG